MNSKNVRKNTVPYLILLLLVFALFFFYSSYGAKVNELSYQELYTALNDGTVKKIELTPKGNAEVYEITGTLDSYATNESFYIKVPKTDSIVDMILDSNTNHDFELVTNEDPDSSIWLVVLINVVPIIALVGLAFWFMTRQVGANNKSLDFGRSQARLSSDTNKKTFKDVAGLVEEKEEVKELIDFLKEPKKFTKLGARIPKGVLLVGPPGTGKTLLAKAVAGEANVPFYFISGSEFVELFVGVGASRVRDMFKQAKANAPCLIFIDEIDAVGRQRGTGLGGGHDEREQTLNQLLTEMDGFGANEGIIVIAATNRADVLDPALLRPGRFDRQVQVGLPDIREREEILKVHAQNKVLASTVSIKSIASKTPGFSGADLENLLNEAALLAVRRDKDKIGMPEIEEATDRVIGGPAKVSRKYTEHEKELVAYHEAGHAVLGLKLEHADVVEKITIIPRGLAGGYTMMLPKEERYFETKNELLDRITGLMGGRVSEELHFKECTTGAHNDFEKATKLARAMVTEYGMSDLGPVQLEQQQGSIFLGRDYNKSKDFSDQVALEIDLEIRKIVDSCYKKAEKILKENQDLVKLIADALMENETITKEQIDYLVENGHMPEEKVEEEEIPIDEQKEEFKTTILNRINKEKKKKKEEAEKKE